MPCRADSSLVAYGSTTPACSSRFRISPPCQRSTSPIVVMCIFWDKSFNLPSLPFLFPYNNNYIMEGEDKQRTHWLGVKDWGAERFNDWVVRWATEFYALTHMSEFDDFTVLNIGGGPVPLRFPKAKEEILVDNNASWFNEHFPKEYREGMTVLDGDASVMKIPDKSVDICYIRKTLEYIPSWQLVLNEVARVMKPDSLLVLIFHEEQGDGINLNLLKDELIIKTMKLRNYEVLKRTWDNNTYVQLVMRKC